ncbi:MAG TPA: hypothetical protein VNO50_09645 [Pyrinomonadaceae bacterium]|nr:hypothetical protein [Pyrinomonadaceae bacterium]
MPVKESSATALVRFTGLGIICFNKDRGRGEIAAIRDNKHTLMIRIQQPVFQDGADNDIVAYQDIATYQKLPNDDVQIEIQAIGKPAIEGYEVYHTGNFDRLGEADRNDFRWIVNMHTLHGDAKLNRGAGQKNPLAKIYIGNGLFYAHKLDQKLFFEKVEKNANGLAMRREVFGSVAETVGVKIEGDEVRVAVRIGGQGETHSLKRVAGLPYRIEIKNMDHSPTAVYSDMPDYYNYLSSPDGSQFDLSPIVEDEAGGAINQQEFCHPIVVDDPPSIDDLE